MELTQKLLFEQFAEKGKPGEITENAYPEGSDECLFYHSTRNRGCCCLLCRHWTASRGLRQKKRYIVVLANGYCCLGERTCIEGRSLRDLQHEPHVCQNACQKFEIIPELKAKEMTKLHSTPPR